MNDTEHKFIVSLHEKNAVQMERYAFRITGDESLAQDLVQKTFLTAILKVNIVIEHENPDAWLFKTLHYIIKREMNKEYRRTEVLLGGEDIFPNRVDFPDSLEEIFPQGLSKSERELLTLRYEKQLSYEDIAEYKGIKTAACRKQVSRAMQHFKKEVEKEKNCHKIQL